MRKYIITLLLFMGSLQATTIQTQSPTIDVDENIIVSVTDMPGDNRDWVAIFPVGATSTFANIVSYRYTNGIQAGDINLGAIPVGNYEARAFRAGTWHSAASYRFSTTGQAVLPTITTTKDIFATNETVTVSITNMPGDNRDWVAIFPVGATNTFANIVSYAFTGGVVAGDINLGLIPAGNYEARAFYANSWTTRSAHAFSVEGADMTPTITTDKESYNSTEIVTVSITNMPGDNRDWVAIFPVGATSTFANIVTYRYTGGITNGDLSMGTLPAGNYEARVYYANSWRTRARDAFTVTEDNRPTIVYEDFESGNLDKWRIAHDARRAARPASMTIVAGFDGSTHAGAFRGSNIGSQNMYSMPMASNSRFILEMDQNVVSVIAHGMNGVMIETAQGPRTMYWDSWINHNPASHDYRTVYGDLVVLAFAHPQGRERTDPDYLTPRGAPLHYRFDLNAYLQRFEPGNHVTAVTHFITGNSQPIDNISLSLR